MSTDFVRNLLIEQRKRLTGSIMVHAEKNIYPQLTLAQQRAFREKVLASVGAYHDTCLDILKASVSDGSLVNAEALSLITAIHADVSALRRGDGQAS
jgi:hypothetical protein